MYEYSKSWVFDFLAKSILHYHVKIIRSNLKIAHNQGNCIENIYNTIGIIVSVDSLASLGSRISTGTEIAKIGWLMYTSRVLKMAKSYDMHSFEILELCLQTIVGDLGSPASIYSPPNTCNLISHGLLGRGQVRSDKTAGYMCTNGLIQTKLGQEKTGVRHQEFGFVATR